MKWLQLLYLHTHTPLQHYALTAAHCCAALSVDFTQIVAGKHDLYVDESSQQVLKKKNL